jgi:hypothetical protein
VSGVADRTPAAQKYHFAAREAPHLFGRERHVMRPLALEITAGDFAFTAGHRRIAISFAARTLNSAAAFSIAAASSGALDLAHPDGFAGDLVDVLADWLRWFRFLRHAGNVGRGLRAFNSAAYPLQLLRAASCFATDERGAAGRGGLLAVAALSYPTMMSSVSLPPSMPGREEMSALYSLLDIVANEKKYRARTR